LSQLKQLRCVLIARERLRQRKLSIASAVDSAWRWSVSVAIKNLGSHTHSCQSRASSAGDSSEWNDHTPSGLFAPIGVGDFAKKFGRKKIETSGKQFAPRMYLPVATPGDF
jgi:hypothetical protein